MGILDTTASCIDDDLLDFTLDGEGEEKKDPKAILNTTTFINGTRTGPFPEAAEEELEWLSNKDAFPAVETCFGILADNPELISNHHSPVSVLENSTNNSNANINKNRNGRTTASSCDDLTIPTNFPVRARTNRQRKKRKANDSELSLDQQHVWPNRVNIKNNQESSVNIENKKLPAVTSSGGGASMGRRCLHCQVDKTPQWRAGPMGPKTLCNACGVRYKSGRLLPEYRPANSPTFSSALHSNSHRKVIEMRKKKQQLGSDKANEACG